MNGVGGGVPIFYDTVLPVKHAGDDFTPSENYSLIT